MKPGITTKGYFRISLSKNRKAHRKFVHHLVLEAFVGPRPKGFEGAHLNGDRKDNRLTNLAWVTHAENTRHRKIHGNDPVGEKHPRCVLTVDQVLEIRRLYSWPGTGQLSNANELSVQFGVNPHHIKAIAARRVWKHLK